MPDIEIAISTLVIVGSVALAAGKLHGRVKNHGEDIDRLEKKVDLIMENHLPHMQQWHEDKYEKLDNKYEILRRSLNKVARSVAAINATINGKRK